MTLNSSITREIESMRCDKCGKSPIIDHDSIKCCCASFHKKVFERVQELTEKEIGNSMSKLFKR
jgi:hypothetical protein